MQQSLLGCLLVAAASISPAAIAKPTAQCYSEPTTIAMEQCVGENVERSRIALSKKLKPALMNQWRLTARAVCAAANAQYSDGTIYNTVYLSCIDQLNTLLLNQFKGSIKVGSSN